MPIEITMPRLSDTMQAGTIVKWNVQEGQKVKSGDVVADIETDKATMELQSFDDGTVASLPVSEGQNVPIGTVIMVLATGKEDPATIKSSQGASGGSAQAKPVAAAGERASEPTGGNAPATTLTHGTNGAHSQSGNGEGSRVFASPLAKKIAAESGMNLTGVQGTGPGGRIIRKDVEAALAGGGRSAAEMPKTTASSPVRAVPALSHAGASLASRTIPLSNMRRVIASRLVESKTTIPHYQVTVEADMDALLALRAQLNEQLAAQGVKLSVNDFLVRACALAMHQHPYINARWGGKPGAETIEYVADVNIGIAISLPVQEDGTGGGLVVATVRSADQIGLRQISAQSKSLSEKARGKGLSPQEMSDSTFTISNLGMFGVTHFTAIINPPNAAILAVGAAVQRPVVRGGQVVPGHVMSMTMSSDHRIIDGAMAAQYLNTVKELLEKPATLLV
ncbi:MAG: 2-oxo acid dehydrogenase subunit E2 [Phycisphaeraceae bacterium]|nr:2-oxo acid dehydrogenase subunit E2 [Phycisphaeraceae bacterium]